MAIVNGMLAMVIMAKPSVEAIQARQAIVAEFIVPIGIAQASLSCHILQIALVAITAITLMSFDGPQPVEETVD